jgi:hypothetical protein
MFGRRSSAIAFGALLGLTWAASLRAYMVEFAGSGSHVDWAGTFAQILLPGLLVGALLGLAEYFRRSGGRRGWRWLAAAPVLFVLAPQFTPGAFTDLVTTGIGGGSIAVPLIGVLGGYAIARRGPAWARILTGSLAVVLIAAGAASPYFIPRAVAWPDARATWVGVLSASLMVLLAFACSIPHRPVVQRGVSPAASSSPNSPA